MIYSRKLLSSAIIVGSMALSTGCTLQRMVKRGKDKEVTVQPSPLEVHADTVKFNLGMQLPTRTLRKNRTYTVNTLYAFGDQREELGDLAFNVTDHPNYRKETVNGQKSFAFPYREEMGRGDLIVRGVASNAAGKTRSTADIPVAKGVITTSKLYKEYYYFAYADHGYTQAEELEPTYVEFFFPQGSSRLQTRETAGQPGKALDAFIAARNVTRTVTITGSHSPEGAETVNAQLANQRAAAIERYYRERMRRFDYRKMADSIDFVQKAIVFDWTPLREELKRDERLTQAQKDEILNVIETAPGDFIQKERQLRSLPAYRTLYTNIYPRLRTAETEILTVIPKKPDNEISAIASQIVAGQASADRLNDKELGYAATLTPRLEERQSIYTAATKKNDSWQSHNNLGATLLEMAAREQAGNNRNQLIERALNHFEISRNKQESAEVLNNIAVATLMRAEGQQQAANPQVMQNLDRALSLNPSEDVRRGINGVKGVQLIKRARYSDAATALGNAKDTPAVIYNRGLAQLLNKDFDRAKASFDEAIAADQNMAWAYYGRAITASRQQNEQAVAENLRSAIGISSDLRAKAINDLEFSRYQESQSFRDAIR
jgi:tetratricopeptide (TPR) repeat protein